MAYRFSDTFKWTDSWFIELSNFEKLLFNYLCDNCDVAGFFEISLRKISFDLRSNQVEIKGALLGLGRGLIISDDGSSLLVKNFIKHQKNLPLNTANKAHKGIFSRYKLYSSKFNGLTLDSNIGYILEAPNKGLGRGTGINIGIGNNSTIVLKSDDLEKKPIYPDKQIEVLIFFDFSDTPKHIKQRRLILDFFYVHDKNKTIDYFIEQFNGYREYINQTNNILYRQSLDTFLGTQESGFADGKWDLEIWSKKLKGIIDSKNKQQPQAIRRVSN